MFSKKILPWVAPVIFFTLLQLANRYPVQMLYWGVGALLSSALSLFWLRRLWLKEKIDFKVFWSSGFLFLLGSFLAFIFLNRPVFRQAVIFVSSFLFFLQMYYAGLFLREKKEFYLGNLVVLNEIFPVLAVFFLTAGFFGWLVFLSKILWVFVILTSFVGLQTGYNLFYNTLGRTFLFSPLWVISLLTAEMFWALNFLPVGFLVKGIILTVAWWILAKALIELQRENKKKITLYIYTLLALGLTAGILLSARWI